MSAAAHEVIEINDDDDDQKALDFLIEENDADLQQALRNSMAPPETTSIYKSEQSAPEMFHTSDSFMQSARLLHWQQQVEGACYWQL
jgi:hypothetical protein